MGHEYFMALFILQFTHFKLGGDLKEIFLKKQQETNKRKLI